MVTTAVHVRAGNIDRFEWAVARAPFAVAAFPEALEGTPPFIEVRLARGTA